MGGVFNLGEDDECCVQVLSSLGYSTGVRSSSDQLTSDLASQLEAWSLWDWAVYVLLHVEDPG